MGGVDKERTGSGRKKMEKKRGTRGGEEEK
jgi:hypothetical protein